MNSEILQRLMEDHGTILVEFYASWCPHCRRMMPVVDDVKALLDGRANVYQFDIDENSALAEKLNVNSVPTFIVYRDGEEQWRTSGEIDGNTLYSKVDEYI